MTNELNISLPLYEGPLDLLLDMIRKQKIDIYDVPIARITEQYLDYLHLMEEMNVDLASEFLVIAAQLIYIKSRMLVPPDPDAVEGEEDDPRTELIRRLLEYEKFKNASQMLYQRELVENAVWTNPGEIAIDQAELEPEMTVTVYDLVSVFSRLLRSAETRHLVEIEREEYTVEQMTAFLWEKITAAAGPSSLIDLLGRLSSRRALITAFLAILELARLRAINLRQDKPFGDISVSADANYEPTESLSRA